MIDLFRLFELCKRVSVCVCMFLSSVEWKTKIQESILELFLYLTQLVLVILNSLVLFSFAMCILIVKLMYI